MIEDARDVRYYLRQLTLKTGQKWQVEVCECLRQAIRDTVPGVEERLQYGKPHYLKNGHYLAVISANKKDVTLLIFNSPDSKRGSGSDDSSKSLFRIQADEAQNVDYDRIVKLLQQAVKS